MCGRPPEEPDKPKRFGHCDLSGPLEGHPRKPLDGGHTDGVLHSPWPSHPSFLNLSFNLSSFLLQDSKVVNPPMSQSNPEGLVT